jgi:cellulose synthase/poly-beta-1,6-N-acetylglucosamine synthase-like glycosyltransferase
LVNKNIRLDSAGTLISPCLQSRLNGGLILSSRFRSAFRALDILFRAAVIVYVALSARRQLQERRDAIKLADAVRDVVPIEPLIKDTPPISILAAAWNEDEDLNAFIAGFNSIDYADKELILAVGGAHRSRDYEHLTGNDVQIIEHPGGEKNRALAECLKLSTAEILVLTDADCLFTSTSFRHLVAPVIAGEDVACGRNKPYSSQLDNLFVQLQWAERALAQAQTQDYTTRLNGRGSCLTRSALMQSGGFETGVFGGDDYYLGVKLRRNGYRFRVAHESLTETHYHDSIGGYVRQRARWLSSVLLNGLRLRDGDAFGAMKSGVRGIVIPALTLAWPLLGTGLRMLLLVYVMNSYLQRLNRLAFAARAELIKPAPFHYVAALLHLYLDLFAAARGLIQSVFRKRNWRW